MTPAHTRGTVNHVGSALSTKVFFLSFGHATACPDCCCCCCWLSTNRTQLHQSLVTHMYRNIDTVYCALNIATHETGTLVPGVLAATLPIPRPLHPTVVRMIRTALLSVVCLSLSICGYLCRGSLALKLKPLFCLCGPPPCCHGAGGGVWPPAGCAGHGGPPGGRVGPAGAGAVHSQPVRGHPGVGEGRAHGAGHGGGGRTGGGCPIVIVCTRVPRLSEAVSMPMLRVDLLVVMPVGCSRCMHDRALVSSSQLLFVLVCRAPPPLFTGFTAGWGAVRVRFLPPWCTTQGWGHRHRVRGPKVSWPAVQALGADSVPLAAASGG